MTIAALDIGTNSTRLLIADRRPDGTLDTRDRRNTITRLGQGVGATGRLAPEAIERTLAALRGYRAEMDRHGVDAVRIAATSAARDAENRDAFFDAVEEVVGARPELLSGEEEGRLSFLGATGELDRAQGPFLVVDIGGGSTEFILGQGAPQALISIDMGCVRMTERHLAHDPPQPAELAACFSDVRAQLLQVRTALPLERARQMIGLAGTVTSLAALQQGLTHYDARRTHHARLTRPQVEALFERLIGADLGERRAMLAEPKRAEVLIGGSCVLLGILRELDIRELLVSETDILDGLCASLIQP
jgi:exopolyphosphatase / guanosine-5'-triphosphate,3'-diphosphate pyrophosphatase